MTAALLTACVVGGAAAYLGSLMMTRRMALVGDALGHVALPGMGAALVLGIDPSWGALFCLTIAILIIWRLGEITLLTTETLVGIVFVSSLALGFLIVPSPELLESLIGDISKMSPLAMGSAVAVSLFSAILVRKIYRGLMLYNISEELAAVSGYRARSLILIYLTAIALIVAVGVKITGSLLVGALIIIPPGTARILTEDLTRYARYSTALGVLSCFVGILLTKWTHLQTGPQIILVSTVLFVLALLKRRLAKPPE